MSFNYEFHNIVCGKNYVTFISGTSGGRNTSSPFTTPFTPFTQTLDSSHKRLRLSSTVVTCECRFKNSIWLPLLPLDTCTHVHWWTQHCRYAVDPEVSRWGSGCEQMDVKLLSSGLSLSEGFYCAGYLSLRPASLWPSRTGVVHLTVKGKRSVGIVSSFASLGVRRRDPASRSDSWDAWMATLRDNLRDRCITGEQSESCCMCACYVQWWTK